MSLPANANKDNPRESMLILVRCFKTDYKAESCMHRPCEKCSIGDAMTNFNPIDAVSVRNLSLIKRAINIVEGVPKKLKGVKKGAIKRKPKKSK